MHKNLIEFNFHNAEDRIQLKILLHHCNLKASEKVIASDSSKIRNLTLNSDEFIFLFH